MSETSGNEQEHHDRLTPDDLVALLRGAAAPDVESRLIAALNDPSSEVSQWVREIEETFSQRSARSPLDQAPQESGRAGEFARSAGNPPSQLNLVLKFLLAKHRQNLLTDEEVVGILQQGIPQGLPGMLMARETMTAALLANHPEFGDELRQSLSPRSLP